MTDEELLRLMMEEMRKPITEEHILEMQKLSESKYSGCAFIIKGEEK